MPKHQLSERYDEASASADIAAAAVAAALSPAEWRASSPGPLPRYVISGHPLPGAAALSPAEWRASSPGPLPMCDPFHPLVWRDVHPVGEASWA